MENIEASYKYLRKSPFEAQADFFEVTSRDCSTFLGNWRVLANFADLRKGVRRSGFSLQQVLGACFSVECGGVC